MKMRPGSPAHVIHIIGSLDTGGAERSVVNYLLHADKAEFRHSVVCFDSRGDMADAVEAAGVRVHVVRIRHRHLLSSVRGLVDLLRREQAAVIHAHMYWAALWGRLAGRIAGVPVMIVTEHGPELWKNRWHIFVERALEHWTSRHIAVARDGREIRLRREGIREDRIVLIPNGVRIPARARDPEARLKARQALGIDPATPIIGTVGRVVVEKGYTYLLDALQLARCEVPGLQWLAVGDGGLRPALTEQARNAGLKEAVVWAGLRSDAESLLAAMDLWVMSSIEEGLPVALLEAMAGGCPIVATRIGGIPDAVTDGKEALLVPAADAPALAAAVVGLLGDPARAAAIGDAARARAVADYSIESVARRIESIYREELGRC
jgi:glycosyltransferase involved in cell wall biosynthesis